AGRDRDQCREQYLAPGADAVAEDDQHGKWDGKVIGIALLEAERTGLEAKPILEEPGAQEGRRAAERDDHGRCRDWAGAAKRVPGFERGRGHRSRLPQLRCCGSPVAPLTDRSAFCRFDDAGPISAAGEARPPWI